MRQAGESLINEGKYIARDRLRRFESADATVFVAEVDREMAESRR